MTRDSISRDAENAVDRDGAATETHAEPGGGTAPPDRRWGRGWLETLVNSVSGIIWEAIVRDGEIHPTYISAGLRTILGYDPAAWLEHPEFWRNHLHPDDRDAVTAASTARRADTEPFTLDYRMLTADGDTVWFRDVVTPLHETAGTVLRGVMFDITGLKATELKLRDREARYRALLEEAERRARQLDAVFDLSPHGFVILDDADRITKVNPRFLELTGLNRDEVIQLSAAQLEAYLASIEDPDAPRDLDGARDEVTLHLQRPEPRVLRRTARASRDASGRVLERVVFYRDVTAETTLARLKSEFVAIAAHELRTPLVTLSGYAELLLTREYPPERNRHMLHRIHDTAGELVTMLNELLDLARIEARRGHDLHREPVRLATLAAAAAAEYRPAGDGRHVVIDAVPDDLTALGDALKLRQALGNVIANAYKYAPEGEIRVTIRRDRDRVHVCVRDDGIGMTAEHAARAFDRFYRANPNGHAPGTGLGLSLVKEIVELHGGEVKLESNPGGGTAVHLWLPPAPAETPDEP